MVHIISKLTNSKEATVFFVDQASFESGKSTAGVPSKLAEQITKLKKGRHFTADAGELFPLVLDKQFILLAGMGKAEKVSLSDIRIYVRKALLSSFLKKFNKIEVVPHSTEKVVVKAILEGILIGTYRWTKYRSDKKAKAGESKQYYLIAEDKREYQEAVAICSGVNLARDLINDNADVVTSIYLESVIKNLVHGTKHVTVDVLNKKELKAEGLGLHLAVNQGSPKEPKLIIVKYSGAGKKEPFTALIGKGITFDTGGLNLKPTGSMETMRCDMSGAAAVIGTLKNVLALKPKKNILFVVGIAENAIGSQAYKPGDVIIGYAGKSVEIGNTDAEGRLVLADAIAYVAKNYRPARIIDIATLTGACVIALGYDYTGLVSTDDKLAKLIIRASKETDDRTWRLPSYPEIKEYVKSPIADIKNVGLPRGAAGTLTAAEFLRQFTNDLPWAHLDIAGTAFTEKGRFYFDYGATGAGVRLLTQISLER